MVVAATVALVACDGEKDQRRTAIADERNPLRGRKAAAGGRRKLGFFWSKGRTRWRKKDI
jgi:hypothetical protein